MIHLGMIVNRLNIVIHLYMATSTTQKDIVYILLDNEKLLEEQQLLEKQP